MENRQVPPAVENTHVFFLQARRKIATTRWLLRAKQQFDFGGAVAQEIGQRRNKKGGGTKKELGRPRASEAASSFVGFLNPWVKEKAKLQQHQGSPTPRGRRKPRPAATWWRLVHRHASVRTPQEEDGGEPGQQDARIFLVSDSRAVFHRLYGTKENVRCGHTSERNVVVVRLGQGA